MTDSEFETRTVRPYAVTGGRVRTERSDYPVEALVELLPAAATVGPGQTPERRAILQHAAGGFISIAELSALLHLPLGVVRVLVGDLADEALLRVHATAPAQLRTDQTPALSLHVLESVLNGISAL